MTRPTHKVAPDYPLAGRGWLILAAALLAWSALIGVAGSVVALIALAGGVS
jgi:hypothetical protein